MSEQFSFEAVWQFVIGVATVPCFVHRRKYTNTGQVRRKMDAIIATERRRLEQSWNTLQRDVEKQQRELEKHIKTHESKRIIAADKRVIKGFESMQHEIEQKVSVLDKIAVAITRSFVDCPEALASQRHVEMIRTIQQLNSVSQANEISQALFKCLEAANISQELVNEAMQDENFDDEDDEDTSDEDTNNDEEAALVSVDKPRKVRTTTTEDSSTVTTTTTTAPAATSEPTSTHTTVPVATVAEPRRTAKPKTIEDVFSGVMPRVPTALPKLPVVDGFQSTASQHVRSFV